MLHPVKLGNRTRMSYSRIDEVLEMPNLIEVQKNSYNWFLEKGLKEVFEDISPITDYTENLVLEFVDYYLDDKTKYTVEERKERDVTYSKPLKVRVRLINRETGEVKEQEVFMGDFPIMTEKGTFIINGAERVIVSQLVRSPASIMLNKSTNGKKFLFCNSYSKKVAQLEYEMTQRCNACGLTVQERSTLPYSCGLSAMAPMPKSAVAGKSERLLAADTIIPIRRRRPFGDLQKAEARPPTVESANQCRNLF